MSFPVWSRVGAIASFLIVLSAAGASADIVDITMTGTLGDGGNAAPWGTAYYGTANQFSVVGDAYTANFQFDTAAGTLGPYGAGQSLSGPGSLLSGTITVGATVFNVPTCTVDPCPAGYSFAQYVQQPDYIGVEMSEEPSSFDGLVLQAFSSGANVWGTSVTDPIGTQAVTDAGIDMVLYDPDLDGGTQILFATATVDTVTVTDLPVPEPASGAILVGGLALTRLARSRARRTSPSSKG